VLQTYSGLVKGGVVMPQIDLKSSRDLLVSRNKYHYDVLGHTTMVDVFGVDEYFRFLPIVVDSISRAMESLNVVLGDLPNQSDNRFREIVKVIPRLLEKYGKNA